MKTKKHFFAAIFIVLALAFAACTIYDGSLYPRQELPVAGITLDRTILYLNTFTDRDFDATTAILTARVFPERASQNVIWGSSDHSVVTVQNGLVTAIGTGNATVTAITRDGGFMAFCEVTVVHQEPAPVVDVTLQDNVRLYLGGTNRAVLTPLFTPIFVIDDTLNWVSGNTSIATVDANGVVTAVGPGVTTITAQSIDPVTEAIIAFDSTDVMVTPLVWQFPGFAGASGFLTLAEEFYDTPPGFFGTAPAGGDGAGNTTTWSGTSFNHSDLVIDNAFTSGVFGRAGMENIIGDFLHPNTSFGNIPAGRFRSHTQFNYGSLAHFAFTGYRQAHPWGVAPLTPTTTRAGHTWSAGIDAYLPNTNTVQFSGIGVDLESDIYIDTVVIFAGGGVSSASPFNSNDINAQSPSMTLEFMPNSAAATAAWDLLYRPNSGASTENWNNPAAENNWPAPGYPGSPWILGGRIVPNGNSWVFVFHFEEPVLARFLRVSFEQEPAVPPATGFWGRAFVNSFEVYNTRSVP